MRRAVPLLLASTALTPLLALAQTPADPGTVPPIPISGYAQSCVIGGVPSLCGNKPLVGPVSLPIGPKNLPITIGQQCLDPARYVPGIDTTGATDVGSSILLTMQQAVALGVPMCPGPGATYGISHIAVSVNGLRLLAYGATFKMLAGTNRPDMLTISGSNNVIEGGTFDGNRANNTGSYAGLLDIFGANTIVRRATVQHAPGFGIRGIANGTVVEDNYLTDTLQSAVWGEALSYAGGDLTGYTIRRNRIEHLTYTPNSSVDMCVQVHATSANFFNVDVEDNTCTMIQGSGVSGASNYVPYNVMGTELLGASSSYQIKGFRLRGNHYSYGGQSWSVGNTRDGTIDDNVSYLPSQFGGEIAQANDTIAASGNVQDLGGTAVGNCMWFSANNTNVTYSGGSCRSGAAGQDGIYAFNTQVALSNVNVEMVNAGYGIHCLACTKSTIDGGVVSGSPTAAVNISQPNGVLVRGVNASGFTTAGISFDDGAAKGTYFYAAIGNMLAPAAGAANITENFATSGDVVTGSALKSNVSTTGTVADVQH